MRRETKSTARGNHSGIRAPRTPAPSKRPCQDPLFAIVDHRLRTASKWLPARHWQPGQVPLWDTRGKKGAANTGPSDPDTVPRRPCHSRTATPLPQHPPVHLDPSPRPTPPPGTTGRTRSPTAGKMAALNLSQQLYSPPPGASPGGTQPVSPHDTARSTDPQTCRTPADSALTRPSDPQLTVPALPAPPEVPLDHRPTPRATGSSAQAWRLRKSRPGFRPAGPVPRRSVRCATVQSPGHPS